MTRQATTAAQVNRTDSERLAWAVRFAQADVTTWRDGDWLNTLEDVKDLAWGNPAAALASMHLIPVKGRPEAAKIKDWLTPLQQALRKFLEQVDVERRSALTPGKRDLVIPIKVPFSGEALFTVAPGARRLQLVYAAWDGPPEKVLVRAVVLRVGDLLTRTDLTRLRRCPECRRLFVAVRRQRFDTAQCSLRDRVRRFRLKGKRTKQKQSRISR